MSFYLVPIRQSLLAAVSLPLLVAMLVSCSASSNQDVPAPGASDPSASEPGDALPNLPGLGHDDGYEPCDADQVFTLSRHLANSDFVAIATVAELEPLHAPVTIEGAPGEQPPRWLGNADDCPGDVVPGWGIRFQGLELLSGEIPEWVEEEPLIVYNFDRYDLVAHLNEDGTISWDNPEAGYIAPGHRLLILALCDEMLGLCVSRFALVGEDAEGRLRVPPHEASCLPDYGQTASELAGRIDEAEVAALRQELGAAHREASLATIHTMQSGYFASCRTLGDSDREFPEPFRCGADSECASVYHGGYCRGGVCHSPSEYRTGLPD